MKMRRRTQAIVDVNTMYFEVIEVYNQCFYCCFTTGKHLFKKQRNNLLFSTVPQSFSCSLVFMMIHVWYVKDEGIYHISNFHPLWRNFFSSSDKPNKCASSIRFAHFQCITLNKSDSMSWIVRYGQLENNTSVKPLWGW